MPISTSGSTGCGTASPSSSPQIALRSTGDYVTVDVKAVAGDEEIDGLTRTDYLYFVGSGEFGAALDEQLAGTKPGDILKVSEEMGEGAGEALQGRVADLTVLVKDVKARRLPDVDDDFAKTASEFDTIEQLRDDLRTRLGEMKEREATAGLRDLVLDAMIDIDRCRHPRDADRRRDRASGDAGRRARQARRAHARGSARSPRLG